MKIGILGCGWLGFPLAQKLLADGFSVRGTTTSEEKLSTLKEAGIEAFIVCLSQEGITGDLNTFLKDLDILIINIPPALRKSPNENYSSKIAYLINELPTNKLPKILFASSTSVYADSVTFPVITENTAMLSDSRNGKQLLEAESLFIQNDNLSQLTTIIRLGGLIGEHRHPIKHLSGKTEIKSPQSPINLVHHYDVIDIIKAIIRDKKWGEIFNVVYPWHPSKRNYYTNAALDRSIALPHFEENGPSLGKFVSSSKVTTELNFTFSHLL